MDCTFSFWEKKETLLSQQNFFPFIDNYEKQKNDKTPIDNSDNDKFKTALDCIQNVLDGFKDESDTYAVAVDGLDNLLSFITNRREASCSVVSAMNTSSIEEITNPDNTSDNACNAESSKDEADHQLDRSFELSIDFEMESTENDDDLPQGGANSSEINNSIDNDSTTTAGSIAMECDEITTESVVIANELTQECQNSESTIIENDKHSSTVNPINKTTNNQPEDVSLKYADAVLTSDADKCEPSQPEEVYIPISPILLNIDENNNKGYKGFNLAEAVLKVIILIFDLPNKDPRF